MENFWNFMDEKLDEKWMKNGWQRDKIWMKLDGRMSANGLTWRENGTNWKHMKRDEDLPKINERWWKCRKWIIIDQRLQNSIWNWLIWGMFKGNNVFQSSNLVGFPTFPQANSRICEFWRICESLTNLSPSSQYRKMFSLEKANHVTYIYILYHWSYTYYGHTDRFIRIWGACRAKPHVKKYSTTPQVLACSSRCRSWARKM